MPPIAAPGSFLNDTPIETAIERLTEDRSAIDRVRANREVYRLLRDGMKVEAEVDGKRETVTVRYVHWNHAESGWAAVGGAFLAGCAPVTGCACDGGPGHSAAGSRLR